MKKNIIIIMLLALVSTAASAQHFRNSRYYNGRTGRLDYSKGRTGKKYDYFGMPGYYLGLRAGATFATVNSDDPVLDGGRLRTGLNVGAVVGGPLTRTAPLFLEAGLTYTEKGGRKTLGKEKMSYNLNYLEVPITLKYDCNIDRHLSVQPFVGGYLACGVGGKIKDYGAREAYSAFGKDKAGYPRFQHFDGGIKVGCGISYDAFYADVSYEYGLSNISHDTFDSTHNSVFSVNVGVNL